MYFESHIKNHNRVEKCDDNIKNNPNVHFYYEYRKLYVNGNLTTISLPTFNLFLELYKNVGQVVPYSTLLFSGWPGKGSVKNNVNVSICQLRLIFYNSEFVIENIRNEGFRLIHLGEKNVVFK